ncbi:hypothetical protein [Aquimarina aquimarini]|uniref:hypothetical protein n=1 Tax=Aquimarina aquimarini TaxID=1191734 RepID=UPI000D562F14|nr:hypothetical protein [Aquimarina aquimarini]
MKTRIEIDVLEFFKTGKFDNLKLGQTKEWILNNFPHPDNYGDDFLSEKVNIWTYGGIELHFEKGKLYLIYSDYWYEGKLDSGYQLKLNKWIFEDISKLNLLYVLTKLNEHDIDYKKKADNLGVLLRLKSGVELTFENINDIEGLKSNDFHITSFALVAENPYRWKE